MREALAMAGALGALVLLTPEGRKATGVTAPSSGASALVRALASKPVAGVTILPHNHSPSDTFRALRRALVAKYGRQDYGPAEGYPATMTIAHCREVIDAWLAAVKVGREQSDRTRVDFSLASCGAAGAGVVSDAYWQAAAEGRNPLIHVALGCADAAKDTWTTNHHEWHLSPLGKAVCGLLWFRRTGLASNLAGVELLIAIQETIDRCNKLAGELEGIAYALPGTRPSDQTVMLDDIAAATVHAAKETGKWALGLAGDIAEEVADEVLDLDIIWVAALGLLAWKVLL